MKIITPPVPPVDVEDPAGQQPQQQVEHRHDRAELHRVVNCPENIGSCSLIVHFFIVIDGIAFFRKIFSSMHLALY